MPPPIVPVVRLKDASVVTSRLAPAGIRILAAIDHAAGICARDLILTCGNEAHPADDPHTRGEAFDVSVHGLADREIIALYVTLTSTLGPLFTVLYETPAIQSNSALRQIATINPHATAPHLHLQPKKGTIFPPESPAPSRPPAGHAPTTQI